MIIETDTLDFVLGSVLSQRDGENRLHRIAFHSWKFEPAEINYKIYDKELLAIVNTFIHWRRYCKGAEHQIQVFSDHHNLEYFTTTKVLNRRQAQCAQELAGIDFRIYHQPGKRNGKPDALPRRPEYRPEKWGIENQPITTVLGKNHFEEWLTSTLVCSSARLVSLPARKWNEEFVSQVKKGVRTDEEYQQAQKEQEAALENPVPKD